MGSKGSKVKKQKKGAEPVTEAPVQQLVYGQPQVIYAPPVQQYQHRYHQRHHSHRPVYVQAPAFASAPLYAPGPSFAPAPAYAPVPVFAPAASNVVY
jgi:hypothetical protein